MDRCADAAEAFELLTAPERDGEAARIVVLGNTGAGKTTLIREFLGRRWPDGLTLIHDDSKRAPQYPSVVVPRFELAPDDAEVITLRGDARKNEPMVEVDDAARLALMLGLRDVPVRLVVDELDRAVTPGGRVLLGTGLRDVLTKGRMLRTSFLGSTQNPGRCPPEVIDQATAIVLCQLGPRALNYLDERLTFDRELISAVTTLPAAERSGNELAITFAVYLQGRPWNGTRYQLRARFGAAAAPEAQAS